MGAAETILKNTGLMLASNIFQKMLKLVLVAVIARMLGVEIFGFYSFIFSYVILFGILVNPGLDNINIRDIARNRGEVGSILKTALSLKMALALLTLLLVVVSLSVLGYPYATILFVLLAGVSVMLDALTDTFKTVFISFDRVDLVFKVNTVSKIFLFVGSFASLFLGFGVLGLVLAAIVSSILSLGISAYYCLRKIVRPSLGFSKDALIKWKAMLLAAQPFFVMGLFMIIFGKIDIIMISYLKGNIQVGYYDSAVRLIESLAILSTSFYTIVFPVMCRRISIGKNDHAMIVEKSTKLIFVLSLPIAFGTTLIAPQIISIIYGPEFIPAAAALSILVWYTVLNYVSEVFNLQLYSMKKEKKVLGIFAVSVSLNIVLNLLLIPGYSFIGSAVATFVAQAVFFVLAYYSLHKAIGGVNLPAIFAKPFIASLLMSVAILLSPVKSAWFVVPLGGIVYFASFILIRGFTVDEIAAIKNVLTGLDIARKHAGKSKPVG